MIIEKNLVALECDLIDDVSRAESTARDRHNIWFWNTTSAFLYRWIGQSSQLRQRRKPASRNIIMVPGAMPFPTTLPRGR